jgi:hypothetical protein
MVSHEGTSQGAWIASQGSCRCAASTDLPASLAALQGVKTINVVRSASHVEELKELGAGGAVAWACVRVWEGPGSAAPLAAALH